MKIVDVQTVPIEIPLTPIQEDFGVAPYISGPVLSDIPKQFSFDEAIDAATNGKESIKKILLSIETVDGVIGWGEIGTHMASVRVGQAIIEDMVAPKLLGKSVSDITALFDEFPRYPSSYYRDITPFLGCAETAMWDALGKTLDQPIHQFLGGKAKESIPLSFCLGLLSIDKSREKARFVHEQGFPVLKTKASRYWKKDIERIKAMDNAVDGELEFRLDPNQMLNSQDIVRLVAQLEDEGIYLQYIEQPVRIDSVGTLKRLRERLKTPIAGGNEDLFIPHNFYQLLREDAIDVGQPSFVPAGGILAMKRLAGVAEGANIPLAHHTYFDTGIKTAAMLHLMSSTPAFQLPADTLYFALENDILEESLSIEDGRMAVPNRPGLAGSVNRDMIEQYRLD